MPKRLHTFTVTVSGPAWLRRADAKREVRTLINESTVWGTVRAGEPFDSIDHGDIRVRAIK